MNRRRRVLGAIGVPMALAFLAFGIVFLDPPWAKRPQRNSLLSVRAEGEAATTEITLRKTGARNADGVPSRH